MKILEQFLPPNRERNMRIIKIVIIIFLVVIYGNSMIPGDASESETTSVAMFIFKNSEIADTTIGQLPWELAHAVIRKSGHLGEYGLLGVLFTLYYTLKKQRSKTHPIHTLAPRDLGYLCMIGAILALIDESIQLVVPGRWSAIMDIWIDAFGFALGVVITWAIGNALVRWNQKKNQKALAD